MGDTLVKLTKKTLMMAAAVGVVVIGGGAFAVTQMNAKPGEVIAATTPEIPATLTAGMPSDSTLTNPEFDVSGLKSDPLKIQAFDRVQGSMTAPVTMIEYASLTCSHCADFSQETVPQIIKDYVATGKVKYVLRDLPWDNLALGMAKVARCAEPEKFFPLVDAFFKGQKDIVTAKDPQVEIERIASQTAGMDKAKVDSCIKDAPLHTLELAMKDSALTGLNVKGTPTSFVNGAVVDGALPYKDVKAIIDAELAKVGAK